MIITKAPFRISLAGGGSDFAEFYRVQPGAVLTMAVNRYMYVTVNRRSDHLIRVSYTRTEIVDHADELKHDLIREAMKMTGVTAGVEITTIADLPAGIGLGSSSVLTVAVLQALYALKGQQKSADELARRACEIEIGRLGRPIGKQDQYIAAFGGFRFLEFHSDGGVSVAPVVCRPGLRESLISRLSLFYTGMTRNAATVLRAARTNLTKRQDTRTAVAALAGQAHRMRECLIAGRLQGFDRLFREAWELKKQMAPSVTNPTLDRLYALALKAGALGGKVSGAGGGGCLLLYSEQRQRAALRRALSKAGLTEVPFALEPEGSRIIYYDQ
jgi:D-glycero-alpha-D-manno-heptose-7-phosphate kinase